MRELPGVSIKYKILSIKVLAVTFPVLFILYTIYFILVPPIHAQSRAIDVSASLVLADNQAADGDIIVSTEKGLVRATQAYTNKLFGVVQKDSLVIYQGPEANAVPIARTGIAFINVTTLNGPIKSGDYITASPIAGKGQKADQSGYVIGVATQTLASQSGTPVTFQGKSYTPGQVPVALRIEYAELTNPRSFSRLFGSLGSGLFQAAQNPEEITNIIRYTAAGFALVASFLIGFFTFSRSTVRGIEAIGRNPLAKNSIQFSIILSTVLTILTIGAGIVASFLILRF